MTSALGSYIPSVSPLFRGSVSYSLPSLISTRSDVSAELSAIKVSPICLASAKVILMLSVVSLFHTSQPSNISFSHGLETISFGPTPTPPANLVIRTSTTPDLKLVLILLSFLIVGGSACLPPVFINYFWPRVTLVILCPQVSRDTRRQDGPKIGRYHLY